MDALRLFMNEEAIRSCHQDAQAAAGSADTANRRALLAEAHANETANLTWMSQNASSTAVACKDMAVACKDTAKVYMDSAEFHKDVVTEEVHVLRKERQCLRMDERERDIYFANQTACFEQDRGHMGKFANCYQCRVVTTRKCCTCERPICTKCSLDEEPRLVWVTCPDYPEPDQPMTTSEQL
jgi:hypothetical protein